MSRYRPAVRTTEFGLLLIPSALAIIGLIMIVVAPIRELDWSWGEIWVSLVFAALVLAMNITFAIRAFRGDQMLLPITAMLSVLGLLMIQRLQPDLRELGDDYAGLAQRQLLFLGIGALLLWLIVMFSGPLNIMALLRDYKYTWLVLTLALQAATFFVGVEVGGAKLWIQLGPIQIQPSEIVKVTLVVFLAGYLDEYRDLIGSS